MSYMKRHAEELEENLRAEIANDVFLALSLTPLFEPARDIAVQVILKGPRWPSKDN